MPDIPTITAADFDALEQGLRRSVDAVQALREYQQSLLAREARLPEAEAKYQHVMDRTVAQERTMRENVQIIEQQEATKARLQQQNEAARAELAEKEARIRLADERLEKIETLLKSRS